MSEVLQYSEKMELLGAESLELRRLKLHFISVYKVAFGLVDLDQSAFLLRMGRKWKRASSPIFL